MGALFFTACDKDDDGGKQTFGTFALEFDNIAGDQDITLVDDASDDFKYTNGMGQTFNVSMLGYYITKVVLEGPNGEYFADSVATSADAAKVKGIYHLLESDVNSQVITLSNVPSGKYDKVTFTVGIPADIVQEGATGGVLDPAEGAWLWNWDAGYIGLAFQGRSLASPVAASQWNPENSVQLHIGGWKEVPGNDAMVNNVKTFTLDFGTSVNVGEKLAPNAHIQMDLLKVLTSDHYTVDFTTVNQVHTPAGGHEIAEGLHDAFEVDHVHQ
jgi:hypothetical protein